MESSLAFLIGSFLQNFGAIELLTNNAIVAFGKDKLLSAEFVRMPLTKRITLLQRLMEERSNVPPPDTKALLGDVQRMCKDRNRVAHNPVVIDEHGEASILIVRHKADGPAGTDKMTVKELRALVHDSHEVLLRFAKLVPEATET